MHRIPPDYASPVPIPRPSSPVSRPSSLVPGAQRSACARPLVLCPRRAAKRMRPSPRPPSRRRSGPSAGKAAPWRAGQQALPKEAGSRPGTPVLRSLARGAASRARPGKSPGRGRSPFLVSAADGGGKKLNHFSSRRVRDEKSLSRSDVQKGSGPLGAGPFLHPSGVRIPSRRPVIDRAARGLLAQMFLGTFERNYLSL